MSIEAQRWAAIDVGTNSVLLIIVESVSLGNFRPIVERATITRLGQGVDKTGHLHPEAEARTLACLEDYKSIINELKVAPARCRAVGTSALRDAKGSADFLQRAHARLGFEVEVVTGEVEARLTFEGALMDLPLQGSAFVFDIGGGSTEFILGNATSGEIQKAASLNLGSVRLTERAPLSDPPTKWELGVLRERIVETLRDAPLPPPPGTAVVGVAGTVTSLAAIFAGLADYDSKLVHGYELNRNAIDGLVEKLSRMMVAERRQLPGLSPGRADVIVAGAMLCQEIIQRAEVDSIIVSDRGVRFGLLRAMTRQEE